jgi:hypothetical protein|tara:strand:+ start:740 stop:979 length:240 start_codon:yes stop_codon:yes gene_type:complete
MDKIRDFNRIKKLFLEKAGPDYPEVPCDKHQDQRCGGWIVRNENNKVLGWVDNSGTVDVYHEVEIKPGEVFNGRPVKRG